MDGNLPCLLLVWFVSVKLRGTTMHHTQEVKCDRRGEAHRLSRV